MTTTKEYKHFHTKTQHGHSDKQNQTNSKYITKYIVEYIATEFIKSTLLIAKYASQQTLLIAKRLPAGSLWYMEILPPHRAADVAREFRVPMEMVHAVSESAVLFGDPPPQAQQ